jgi:hypothetical protein
VSKCFSNYFHAQFETRFLDESQAFHTDEERAVCVLRVRDNDELCVDEFAAAIATKFRFHESTTGSSMR